jgi:hypothetical protein
MYDKLVGSNVYRKLVAPKVSRTRDSIVFDESERVAGTDRFTRELAQFNPEVIVCAGNSFPVIEQNVQAAFGGEFKLRLNQVMPVSFLCREMQQMADPILTANILAAGDNLSRYQNPAWSVVITPFDTMSTKRGSADGLGEISLHSSPIRSAPAKCHIGGFCWRAAATMRGGA